jgi:predicted Abi (CAAX) family protease
MGQAFTIWPDLSDWLACAGVMALSFALIAAIAKAGRLLIYAPKSGGHVRRLVTAIFIPSIGEETVFRIILWPSGKTDLWAGLSLVLFVLWHVIEGKTFLKAHGTVLLNLCFLICAAILGLACMVMVSITHSIWPAIFTHAFLVYVWQSFFGGLSLFEK